MQSMKNVSIEIESNPINTLQCGDYSRPTLLFLHGKAFQAETWLNLGTLEAAVDAGFSILALDLPGFGKSPEAGLAPDQVINGVMHSVGLEKALVVGPSMGGKVALEFSLSYPEKIAGLVLIGAVGVEENRDRLHRLPSSSLIVWGEKDTISDPANGDLLHNSIPGSKLVVFKDAQHPCYLEQPELWHKTLLDFAQTVLF